VVRALPVAVPEICCSLFARQISTAATRLFSLHPPPAALETLPKLSHTSMYEIVSWCALLLPHLDFVPDYYSTQSALCQDVFAKLLEYFLSKIFADIPP